MPAASPGRFERLLHGLDADELASFVADVWRLRGRETRVEGDVVVATGGPFEEPERLYCVAPGRWARPELPDGDVDAVVSTRPSDRLLAAVEGRGLRFVGPHDLREVLLYAVDREAANRVFASYFDRPLTVEGPRHGVVGRVRAVTSWRTVGAGLLLVMLAGVLVAGAGVGDAPFADSGAEPTPDGPSAESREASSSPDPSGEPAARRNELPPGSYPIGLAPDGVEDPNVVASAHGQEIVRTSYDLLIVHDGSRDVLASHREWAFSRQTVARFHTTHYWYRFAGLEVLPNGTRREVVFDDFADGTYVYRRFAGPDEPTYERGLIPTGGGNGLFTAVGEAYIRRYLATTESDVEPVPREGQTMFRVVATGTPTRIDRPVDEYRAVAIVNWVGLVHSLTVEYTLAPEEGTSTTAAGTWDATPSDGATSRNVSFEMVYRDVYGTTVGEPPWYDEARASTNETATNMWPRDERWWSPPVSNETPGDS